MKYLYCLLFAWLMVGCLPAGSTLGGPALVHPNFPYAVTYDDERERSVMGKDWDLETYRIKTETAAGAPVELERKRGYDATYAFDFDNDDQADAKEKLPIPDLVFVNRRTSARLEVATLLLDQKLAGKELRVLLNEVVDGGSGTRSLFVGFGRAVLKKRFASRLVDRQEAALGGQKGLVATIDRVDLDQLAANPKARWRRSRLFLVHAPFEYYATESVHPPSGSDPTSPANQSSTRYHPYKVLLLVEYTNAADDFEAQYPEFLRLLGKLHLMDDERVSAYLGTLFEHCSSSHSKESKVTFDVSPVGVASINDSSGFDPQCLSSTVNGYSFAASGKDRKVSASFDLSKSRANPEWLSKSDYSEQRPAAANEPATEPAAAPAPAPGEPAAPATAPGGAPAAPATPSPQPGGDSASSSSANSPESGSSSKP